MNNYLNYLVEANIGLVLFLAAYILVLRKETDFRLQRLFLLAGILASLIFPLVHISNSAATHSILEPTDSLLLVT